MQVQCAQPDPGALLKPAPSREAKNWCAEALINPGNGAIINPTLTILVNLGPGTWPSIHLSVEHSLCLYSPGVAELQSKDVTKSCSLSQSPTLHRFQTTALSSQEGHPEQLACLTADSSQLSQQTME